MAESEIRVALETMRRTINDFCESPINIKSECCRKILSDSSLDKNNNNKEHLHYYVIHTGSVKEFQGLHDDEHIYTVTDLEILSKNNDKVAEDYITLADTGCFMEYGTSDDDQRAIVCNINGYDLAILNNKYNKDEIGRNILFGNNLRESLDPRKSKSYRGMFDTIHKCPSNYWYYNNGITIVAEDVATSTDKDGKTTVKLSRFSIVNGAQTTSTLVINCIY